MSLRLGIERLCLGGPLFWLPLALACASTRPAEEPSASEESARTLQLSKRSVSVEQAAPPGNPKTAASDEKKLTAPSAEPMKDETDAPREAKNFCPGAALDEAIRSTKGTSAEGVTSLRPAPKPSTGFKDPSIGPAYFGTQDWDFDGVDDSIFLMGKGSEVRFFFFVRKEQCDDFLFALDGLQVEGRERREHLELRVFLGKDVPGGLRHFTYDAEKGMRERLKVTGAPGSAK